MGNNTMYCNKCTKRIIPSAGYYQDHAKLTMCWNCLSGHHPEHLDFDCIVSPLLDEGPSGPEAMYYSEAQDHYRMSDDLLVNLHQMLGKPGLKGKSGPSRDEMQLLPIVTPAEVNEFLGDYVVGQDLARKTLSVVVSNHRAICEYNQDSPKNKLKKSNLLIMGPSGTGKTLMIEKVAEFLNVPYVSTSATEYTESGYVGKDVEQVLQMLLDNAGGDHSIAENGIVFIDEVDKILSATDKSGRDVSGAGVQHALLRMVEGGIINIADPSLRGHAGPGKPFDTSNVLFIFGGAFTNLRESKEKVKEQLGFTAVDKKEVSTQVTSDDLIQAGLIREFVGRVQHIVTTETLTDENLLDILTGPKDNIIAQHEKLMKFKKLGNMDLRDPKFLQSLVEEAKKIGTGARGLKVVLEQKLLDVYYEG